MALDLGNYETLAREAVQTFWGNRSMAADKQREYGKVDQGNRANVTAGKNMDGFIDIILEIVRRNGLKDAKIHLSRKLLTLPGYYRPTKLWDVIVMHEGRLIAAVELKSQVGPSFGNNFNNRTEEAIGTGHDFWVAYREGAFGKQTKPFIGWLILVEDDAKSRTPVANKEPLFRVFPEFSGASYLNRYDLLCQKMMQERLYSAACLLAAPRSGHADGRYRELSKMSGLRSFVAGLAGHVAAEAAKR